MCFSSVCVSLSKEKRKSEAAFWTRDTASVSMKDLPSTWRQFRADYSVRELEIRFAFEREWSSDGKSIRSRAFYNALKQRIDESKVSA